MTWAHALVESPPTGRNRNRSQDNDVGRGGCDCSGGSGRNRKAYAKAYQRGGNLDLDLAAVRIVEGLRNTETQAVPSVSGPLGGTRPGEPLDAFRLRDCLAHSGLPAPFDNRERAADREVPAPMLLRGGRDAFPALFELIAVDHPEDVEQACAGISPPFRSPGQSGQRSRRSKRPAFRSAAEMPSACPPFLARSSSCTTRSATISASPGWRLHGSK